MAQLGPLVATKPSWHGRLAREGLGGSLDHDPSGVRRTCETAMKNGLEPESSCSTGCLLPPAFERDDRAIGAFVFSAPPRAVGPACGQVGKMVIVDQSARIARRSLGQRIVRYQAEHRA